MEHLREWRSMEGSLGNRFGRGLQFRLKWPKTHRQDCLCHGICDVIWIWGAVLAPAGWQGRLRPRGALGT